MISFSSRLRGIRWKGEDAQAMIFFAIVATALGLTTGLAVEGGRIIVDYRRLQAAADMSALIGAQALPCSAGDTNCYSSAEALACQTAANNGVANCNNGGPAPAAYVPPVTCSPYDALDYGNDSGDTGGNPKCKSTSLALTSENYIEVQLTDNLGTIPIFNVPVTLSAHAVARHGVPSTKDYAVSQLDSSAVGKLTVGGSFDFFVNGSTFANGVLSPGATSIGCEGGFFTAQNTSDPRTEVTYSGGIAGFAPPACYQNDGTTLQSVNSDNWDSNLPKISDPYCSSVSPPYLTNVGTDCDGNQFGLSTMPNCADCTSAGWYYDIGSNVWIHDTASNKDLNLNSGAGGSYEMFPGVYGNFAVGKTTQVYMNPGVYTFTGSVSFDTGQICVFGAPICNSGTGNGLCGDTRTIAQGGSAAWTPGPTAGSNATGNSWYYKCSPYGFWDTKLTRPDGAVCVSSGTQPVTAPSCTAPTFWDTTGTNSLGINGGVGHVSAVPLNGMTWQFTLVGTQGNTGIGGTGTGNSGLAYYVAAPNPCPGTGTGWTTGATSVSFNNGDPAAQYTYTSTSSDTLATTRYGVGYQSPIVQNWGWSTVNGVQVEDVPASQIYPSMDLKTTGECTPDNLEVWPGEMGGEKGQHLHFALFDRQTNLKKLAGNQGQSFFGILYFPGTGTSGPTYDVTGAGSAGGGPPFIYGQLVAWDVVFRGNGTVDLIYRPCNDKEDVCATGLGTQLVQ